MSVAFTPTSVIRKMHSDKASEKDKQKPDGLEGTPAPPPPVKQLIRPDGSINEDDSNEIDRHLNKLYNESKNGMPPQSEYQINTSVPPPGYSMSGTIAASSANTDQVSLRKKDLPFL